MADPSAVTTQYVKEYNSLEIDNIQALEYINITNVDTTLTEIIIDPATDYIDIKENDILLHHIPCPNISISKFQLQFNKTATDLIIIIGSKKYTITFLSEPSYMNFSSSNLSI